MNPIGDVRDIIANGKKVIQGDGKATIPLIASIIGAIPSGGAKVLIKTEEKTVIKGLEKATDKKSGGGNSVLSIFFKH